MQDPWALLSEALKYGYGTPVLLIALALVSKPWWLEMTRIFAEWVRSTPARRRAALEGKVVDQALNASTKEQCDRACEVLKLLLRAPASGLPEPPTTDPLEAAGASTGDSPPERASTAGSSDGGETNEKGR